MIAENETTREIHRARRRKEGSGGDDERAKREVQRARDKGRIVIRNERNRRFQWFDVSTRHSLRQINRSDGIFANAVKFLVHGEHRRRVVTVSRRGNILRL